MERRTGLWVLLALLGLVLAAGVTAAASELSNQRVGLASEPLSAGDDLAPPAQQRQAKKKSPARSNTPSTPSTSPTTTTAPPVVTPLPVEPGDDHGSGRGRSDHDGDDD